MQIRSTILFIFVAWVLVPGCSDDNSPSPQTPWQWQEPYPGLNLFGVAGDTHGFYSVGQGGIGKHSEDGGVSWNVTFPGGSERDFVDAARVAEGWILVGTRGDIAIDREHVGGWSYTEPTSFDFNAVASSGSILVTVGTSLIDGSGGVFQSTDIGLHWSGPVRMDVPLHDILWDGTEFVACGDLGSVATSLDGITWSISQVGTTESLIALSQGDQKFMTIGNQGGVFLSSDLRHWAETTRIPGHPFALTWGGTFLAVGEGGKAWLYDRLGNWQSVTTGIDTNLRGVASANGTYIAVGDRGVVLRSENGRTWDREFGGLPADFSQILWTGNHFMIKDWYSGFLSSLDGAEWTRQDVGTTLLGTGMIPYPGGFITFNWNGGKAWQSPDGIHWQSHDSNHPEWSISDAVWYKDRFLAVGLDGAFQASTDGFTWSALPSFAQVNLWSIALGDGKIVVGGQYGTVYISGDGQTWQTLHPAELATWDPYTLAVGFLQWTETRGFLGISNGRLIQSPDGVSWTIHPVLDMGVSGYVAAQDRVYAVGYQGRIASSVDLVTWESEDSGTTNDLNSVVASPAGIFAVGRFGTLLKRL